MRSTVLTVRDAVQLDGTRTGLRAVDGTISELGPDVRRGAR